MSFEITIPRLGWSMEEGIFAGWMKKDGDVVRRGDALFELEGEKALQEIEALDDGILRITADGPQPGTVLKVGAVIWLPGRRWRINARRTDRQHRDSSRLCDRSGREYQSRIDQQRCNKCQRSGLTVCSSACQRTGSPVTLTSQADAANLVSLREQFKSAGKSIVPAFHDLIAKLVADCLIQERRLAGRWDGDAIVLPVDDEIHIGIAVDTPEGLIVPVLRNVVNEPLLSLAAESSRIIRKARDGRLSGADMQDAVFTITNLGGFGIDAFTPVINLPETAILGLGAIRKQAVVVGDDRIEVRTMMTLSLTFDHRAIDGAPAARFLQSVVAAIENPAVVLCGK